ncbi:single-stranded DNA-binding protein [Neolewinella persica]|uniref:single-stranded DNA-binding protein n=1 Tax=Neolewinella persica TaxID=70998 RepID=UPI00039CE177|nr:single-stranded DNA-binding protein [Neolewinella persica]
MPFSLNQIQLVGRAGHDVDLHTLSDGTPLSRLRLYQDGENRAGEPASSVFMLNAWGTLAASFHERVRRGDTLFVQGRLHIRSFHEGGAQHFRPEVHVSTFYIMERTHRRPVNTSSANHLRPKKTSSSS